LIRLGVQPKGIVASGYVDSKPFKEQHFRSDKKFTNYIKVKFDCILDSEFNNILEIEYLSDIKFQWFAQSAKTISDSVAKKIEIYWTELAKSSSIYPNEIIDNKTIYEGSFSKVLVNKYERNPEARQICLSQYGYSCSVCSINFENVYGDLGKKFIHVHHIKPLSEIQETYIVNPLTDLVPVCPNCHAMFHRSQNTLSISKLREILNRNKQ